MDNLDKLWLLEENYRLLDDLQEQFNQLERQINIKELDEKRELVKKRQSELENNIKKNKLSIKLKEEEIRLCNEKLMQIEDDLYGGLIKDLKQLEHMTSEKEYLIGELDGVETELLISLEQIETDQSTLIDFAKDLNKINDQLDVLKKDYEEEKRTLIDQIFNSKLLIKELEEKTDKGFLDIFLEIRSRKSFGIARVKDYICEGCNMRIPTYLGSDIKDRSKITLCENCGRILYYEAQIK